MPSWALLLIEIMFVAVFLFGVMVIWWPAAFLVAGVVGVVACERWSVAENARRAARR